MNNHAFPDRRAGKYTSAHSIIMKSYCNSVYSLKEKEGLPFISFDINDKKARLRLNILYIIYILEVAAAIIDR